MQSKEIITAPKIDAITSQDVVDSSSICGALSFNIMKEIKLTQGKVALVDDEDYERLNKLTWCAAKRDGTYYAYTTNLRGKRGSVIAMHRLIMNTPKGLIIDHIDHNGLNNQKSNLRNCTASQNNANRTSKKQGTSKYLGVSFYKPYNKYHVQIRILGKNTHVGYYKNEIDAAIAYNEAATRIHGKYANINYIKENADKL